MQSEEAFLRVKVVSVLSDAITTLRQQSCSGTMLAGNQVESGHVYAKPMSLNHEGKSNKTAEIYSAEK